MLRLSIELGLFPNLPSLRLSLLTLFLLFIHKKGIYFFIFDARKLAISQLLVKFNFFLLSVFKNHRRDHVQ